jgi:hypothetical protein
MPYPDTTIKDILNLDGNLYDPPPLPPHLTGPQIISALHNKVIAGMCNQHNHTQSMEVDSRNKDFLYNTNCHDTRRLELVNAVGAWALTEYVDKTGSDCSSKEHQIKEVS